MGYALSPRSRLGLTLALIVTLGACQVTDATAPNPDSANSPTTSAPAASDDAERKVETAIQTTVEATGSSDATITSIQQPPVWVKPIAGTDGAASDGSESTGEVEAQVGKGLNFGDILRTEAEALAEVAFASGLAFRLGGDAILVLQPDNRLALESGEVIVWVEPGKQVPTEIMTPAGVAGLRGTTLFIEISEGDNPEVHLLAWEGTVTFMPADATGEPLILEGGQGIRLRRGETDLAMLKNRIQRLNRRQIRQRRRQSRLLNGFNRPISTQEAIDRVLETSPE
ncbi:MAG: FecR domain-containing protein [Cyanobacteria bacterium P01_H01_bin.119]